MRKVLYTLGFLIGLSQILFSQISFTNSSNLLGNQGIRSGYVFGVSDLNGDGLDDIIRFKGAKQALIDYQNIDGTFTPLNIGDLTDSEVWSVVIADIDEDGINDFITGAYYEPIIQVKPMANGMFDISELDGPNIFMQGASFADIDNNGAIDYFACNDDFLSNPYRNDGNGNLSFDPTLIDTETSDPAFNSGNYSCTWVDYDNDGDSDMYLSKCRLGVIDSTDERRLNRMFRNDGNGNYTDVAEEIGLRPMGQTWAVDFGDIDNDGDMDAIMINHDINTMLFINDGNGNFTDISIEAGIDLDLSNFPTGLQTYMYDFDNDTYQDILLTSYNTIPVMYHNNGNSTFSRLSIADVLGTDINTDNSDDVQSGAIGDLNNDGFMDCILGFANGINIPNGVMNDRLYLNDGNDNNYVKVDLTGEVSNINGIGARIEVNGPFGTLIRDVKSGQGYGIMNSLQPVIGIGDATEISNIKVKWPSGCFSVVNFPPINSTIEIAEICGVVVQSTKEICDNEPIMIDGVEINTSGVYYETISTNGMDTIFETNLIVYPSFTNDLPPAFGCYGDTIIVDGEPVSTSGQYFINDQTENGCDSITIVNIEIFDPIDVTAQIVDDWGTLDGFGSITLNVSNVIQPYSIEWSTGVMDAIMIDGLLPDDYTATITDGNGCLQTFVYTIGLNTSLVELQERGFDIYPIPTKETLFINDKYDLASKFELFTVVGKRVIAQNIVNQTTVVNTSELTSGLYILKMYDENNRVLGSAKVIKE